MTRETETMQSARERDSNTEAARSGYRPAVSIPLSIALLSAGFALPVTAQTAPPSAVSADAIKQRDQELEAARAEQKHATELQQQLQA